MHVSVDMLKWRHDESLHLLSGHVSLPDVMASDRCSDCDIGLIDFWLRYCGKTRDLFDLCVRHKIVLENKDCGKCGKTAVLSFTQKLWRCQRKKSRKGQKKNKCSWQQSAFKNTFFDNAHIDFETIWFS